MTTNETMRYEGTPRSPMAPIQTLIGTPAGDLVIHGTKGRDSGKRHVFLAFCPFCRVQDQVVTYDTYLAWRDHHQRIRCKASLCAARLRSEETQDAATRRDSAKTEYRQAQMLEDIAACPLLATFVAENPKAHTKVVREYWASKDRADAQAYLRRQQAIVKGWQDKANAEEARKKQREVAAHNCMLRQYDTYIEGMALAGKEAAPWIAFKNWSLAQQAAMVDQCGPYIARLRKVKAMSPDQMHELYQTACAKHLEQGGKIIDLDFNKFYEDLTAFDM